MALQQTGLVETELNDGIGVIALNRPETRNAVDDDLRAEFIEALDWAGRTKAVRSVILTGRGASFCAGGDIKAMKERLEAPAGQVAINGWNRQQRNHHAVMMLHNLPKPTIAAVNGAAAGLGADLALCCDFAIASDKAMFVMSYVLRGLVPDGGGLYFLPRRVGLARAKELIFSARRVEAAEAGEIGMVDQVVPADRLMEEAVALAERMSVGSPTAVTLAKSILNETFEHSLEQVFARGSQAQAICYTTEEHHEAVAAFLEKRG